MDFVDKESEHVGLRREHVERHGEEDHGGAAEGDDEAHELEHERHAPRAPLQHRRGDGGRHERRRRSHILPQHGEQLRRILKLGEEVLRLLEE